MPLLRSAKARHRAALLALVVSATAVVWASALLVRVYMHRARAEALESWGARLESAVDGRVAGMSSWAEDRLRVARLVANYPSIRTLLSRPPSAREADLAHVRELLEEILHYQPLRAVYVLDADGGVVARAEIGRAHV